MEGYDEEYIKRIQKQAKGFEEISKWLSYASVLVNEVDLSKFRGVILRTKPGYIYYAQKNWSARPFVTRDSETITIYVYVYEKNILAIAEVSVETFEHVIQENASITKWLKENEEKAMKEYRDRKSKRKAKEKIVANDAPRRASFWTRVGF